MRGGRCVNSIGATILNSVTASHNDRSIIFYFPYKGVGGVSVLFLRLGKLLANHRNVYYVDFADGYMAKRLPLNSKLIPFGSDTPYPENSIFVFQTVGPWNLIDSARFPADSKVIFWNLFPYNLNPNLFLGISGSWIKKCGARFANVFSLPRRWKLSALLALLVKRKSIMFMDGENLSTVERLFGTRLLNPIFLPVITDVPANKFWSFRGAERERLRVAWVGRVEDFKVPILRHLIMRLEIASGEIPITLMVVGSGAALNEIKDISNTCSNLLFDFRGEVSPESLSNVLTEEVDILFAMGTSALEGAKYGVPTVLLDYSYKEISGLYRFRYIYTAREFTLGEEIGARHLEPRCTLTEIINVFNHRPNLVSEMSFNHWDLFHNPDRGCAQFLSAIEQAEATVGELRELNLFTADIASRTIKAARNYYLPKSNATGIGSV